MHPPTHLHTQMHILTHTLSQKKTYIHPPIHLSTHFTHTINSHLDEITLSDGAEDLVDGVVGGQGAVEDVEVTLEALRDVVTTTTRVDHGRDDRNVHETGELSRFLQVVESLVLHHLTSDLVCHLQKCTRRSTS